MGFPAVERSADGPMPPAHWQADVVLSDGGTVHLRPIAPGDAGALVEMHSRLSERTVFLRFFGAYPKIPPRDLERFTTVDHHDRVALIAVLGDEMVAVARYERVDADSAEVAFVVRDDHQGRGIGSILLEHLAAAARECGIRRFVAEVLAENRQMIRVFIDAGYQVRRERDAGVLHLEFDIGPTDRSIAVAMDREQAAEARSVHNLLHPGSVAVIGASSDPAKIGHVVLRNLVAGGFTGRLYPVHPDAATVLDLPAYRSVADVPGTVDLAVVAVPAASVAEVTDTCLAKGVKGLLVVSAGFAEAGPRGGAAQRQLVGEVRAHGMRLVGPNALGVVNTDSAVRLNASLAPVLPGRGRVGFFCQSGALGIAILAEAARRGLGLSEFVSAGNRADVSGNDLLQYWQTDPATDVVLLYLESFGNPRKFTRLVRRLARGKPIVAVSSGRHVGSPVPEPAPFGTGIDDATVRALFEQAGVISVESLDELFDTALLLANQPLPAGQRVAVVGNSSALGLLVADAVLANGLSLAGQPVDVGATAGPDAFGAAVRKRIASADVDVLVAVFVPPVALPGTGYARALRAAAAEADKPVVSTFLAAEGIPAELAVPGQDAVPGYGSVPSYPSPERAVLALARVARYAEWRRRPAGEYPVPEGMAATTGMAGMADARELAERWLAAADDTETTQGTSTTGPHYLVLSDDQATALLATAGITVVSSDQVPDPDRAVPVTFGLTDDPTFGSLLSFGLHGVLSELLGDRAYRALPLSTADAAELIAAPRAAPLLTGHQGAPPVDTAALADLALRLSRLGEQVPQLRRVCVQPVLATPDRVYVTGAKVAVGAPPSGPAHGPRRLA